MPGEKPFHNPFAALGEMKGSRPAADIEASPLTQPVRSTPPESEIRSQARAVVRYERSGRGGKQVTVIEQLDLTEAERAEWLRALKSALGCGGALEGADIVLQGDQRKRLPALLTARHVRRVTVS